jgi:predicted transcriptional regulator
MVSMSHVHRPDAEGIRLPEELTSPRAKLVYLYVATHGGASIDELSVRLGMKKLALYSIVELLGSRELIRRDGSRYVLT